MEEGSNIGLKEGKYYNKMVGNLLDDPEWYSDMNYDFSETGLGDVAKIMIEKASWSNAESTNSTAINSYFYAKQNKYKTKNNVGIIGVSDYGLSVLDSECKNKTLEEYELCKTWIDNNELEIVIGDINIDEMDGYTSSTLLTPSGTFELYGVTAEASYRPSVYLKENVVITGGNGKIGNKYEIALSE